MIEIDWRKDYQREFVCPECHQMGLRLAGTYRYNGKRKFRCCHCEHTVSESFDIQIIDFSNQINWRNDYHGEFICPKCNSTGMQLEGTKEKAGKSGVRIRNFKCPTCGSCTSESCTIKWNVFKSGVNWLADYKIGEFACPSADCNAKEVKLRRINGSKQGFICAACGTSCISSIDLESKVIRRFSEHVLPVKPFNFADELWDLKAVSTAIENEGSTFTLNFKEIKVEWFKLYVKQYIYKQCRLGKPYASINSKLSCLRAFSAYLAESNITDITQITRNLILSFLAWDKQNIEGKRQRLGGLRDFFWIGTVEGWFALGPDLIRDSDFPKRRIGNPDPIPDVVRTQIEQNLHKLPDPFARMWIVCFFAAMRPIELAMLRKDCLVQEGSQWKLRWGRAKGKDEHEVPITRTIAKVVQEQLKYIEQLWGEDWEYLFCHYRGVLKDVPDLSFPELRPVRRILSVNHSPFNAAVRCLIRAENIRDDNGKLAMLSQKLVRPTRLTELFAQGHDLDVVSAWAGHKSLSTTGIFYTQVSCDLIAEEAGYIQIALFNAEGRVMNYESLPKSFWKNPPAHELALTGDHINTPIYGFCGLPLDEQCDKFRACYTCPCFFATAEKLPFYIEIHDELRAKEASARENGQDVLVEQFGRQADQLDKVIVRVQEEP